MRATAPIRPFDSLPECDLVQSVGLRRAGVGAWLPELVQHVSYFIIVSLLPMYVRVGVVHLPATAGVTHMPVTAPVCPCDSLPERIRVQSVGVRPAIVGTRLIEWHRRLRAGYRRHDTVLILYVCPK